MIDFGEIATWWSVYLASLPALLSTSLPATVLAVLSPAFVSFLLLKVSGIPLSEKSSQKKYGGDVEYAAYVLRTPLLFPQPPFLHHHVQATAEGGGAGEKKKH
jgi:steroid 5-alpha reductase family enzyme